MNINKVILMGRLTADPELKTTAGGTSVVQFSVAVNRKYSKEEQKVDFIDCTAFGKTADFLGKYFRKGSSVIVFGNIQVESWKDKDGNSRRSTKIIVDELQFGESKKSETEPAQIPAAEPYSNATNADFFSEIPAAEDADLPF